ncbi:Biogenesis of lysosome-related organelles complex 1 subunit 1 [Camellia lanceoleosa]|uniref:Biogenesis of lysosome-related organelles complex 1 subunit 1 n=1 Tax=Camellia lanceoleosa TaxID=1840588 RepID=A0ACC0F1W2_9ERIC|nr:Biogenesis of lysosome-related organelles complex 1 subunit 1 [Camellia lanceoleosa]
MRLEARSVFRICRWMLPTVASKNRSAKRIKLETRALAATVMRFVKQTDRWLAASHAINTAIKVPPISSPPLFTNYITRSSGYWIGPCNHHHEEGGYGTVHVGPSFRLWSHRQK